MLWKQVCLFGLACVGRTVAKTVIVSRPDNQSICDYYAEQLHGESNITTQLRLMQAIVAYAYAGGDAVLRPTKNATNGTGIFNPGQYNGKDVFLRSWFDGSKATTNLQGAAVKVDWLDGGGLDPLYAFLNGSTDSTNIRENSNQDILFSHWYVTFGKIYKCTQVGRFVPKEYAPFTPAYVHKYMSLDQTQVAYFIEQIIIASKYYGFSESDAQQLSLSMNAKYNNKCAPPDATGQLNSVCFADSCPLASDSDCSAYSSIGPYGFKASTPPTGTATGVVPTVPASQTSPGSNSPDAGADNNSSKLSAGAIAGIAIGSAAVLLLAVGMWLFFRRQQKAKPSGDAAAAAAQNPMSMSQAGPVAYSAQSPYGGLTHDSYYSRNGHESYVVSSIGSPGSPPPAWEQAKSPHPQELATESTTSDTLSPNPSGGMHQIAEMDGPDLPQGWGEQQAKQ